MVSLPRYVEVSAPEEVDAWLERDGEHVPLKRVADDELDPFRALRVAPKNDAAAARLDARTLSTIDAVTGAMDAVSRVAPALAVMSNVPTMPRLPRLPAIPSAPANAHALSVDELAELERIGLGVTLLSPSEARKFGDPPPPLSDADRAAFAAAARHFPRRA